MKEHLKEQPQPQPSPAAWTRKDLLGIAELSREEILTVLDTAESFTEVSTRSVKKVPALRGKVMAALFFEPSTRTSNSFTLAAKRLSADVLAVNASVSSVTKGESLKDTAKNLSALGIDIVVVRHPMAGAAHQLAQVLDASVVNAGDGAHEHPTQGLLDLFTIRSHLKKIEGLKVAIVGDIAHSRVARSNIWALRKLGAQVTVVGPATLIPSEIASLGVKISYDLDSVLEESDVLNFLRIQLERQSRNLFPSIREYARLFGMNAARARRLKKSALILHPGPVNRGVELAPEVADGPHSVILEQVANGLAVRMAVLYLVAGARN